jgi:MFS family permease
MLRELLIGNNPTQFHVNPIVKVFILAETMLWGAMNFILPIFALFVTTIPGGNVEVAATVFSVYMLIRVVFELVSGRLFAKTTDDKKLFITILGMVIMSAAYIGFAFSTNLFMLYSFYGLLGLGIGIISPVKNTLFSTHLDKNREATEWGILDAIVFFVIAVASAVGGYIAQMFGFQTLFLIAATINILGIIPYLFYFQQHGYDEPKTPLLLRIFFFFFKPKRNLTPPPPRRM